MAWTIVIFLITISLLVTIHEFGHFIVAKLCGVRVERFSVGFGKKLWSYKSKNDTEFTFSVIPLGGYVKMLDGRNADLPEESKQFAFDHQSIFKRSMIVSAGPIANMVLAFIIYWIAFQIGVTIYPAKVVQTIPNTPAASVNIPQDVELKSIAGIKVESWSDVNSVLMSELGSDTISIIYEMEDKTQHTQLINTTDWQFDVEKESPISAFGFIPSPVEIKPIIGEIVENSAAKAAGLKVGDEIIRYNDKPYNNWDAFSSLVRQAEPITLDIRRDNEIITLNLIPKRQTDQYGQFVGVAGIYPTSNTNLKQYDIVSAFEKSVRQVALTTRVVLMSFYQLLTGELSVRNLSGPLTIAQSAGQTASYGVVPYLFFLAFISISLGVVNLVPLPMLDGGHLLFLLIEKIKGSPLSNAKQEVLYRIGFILLMTVMGIAFFNDFIRLS